MMETYKRSKKTLRVGFLITVFLLLFSCAGNKKQLFKNSLNNYIDEHPINLLYQIDSLGNKKRLNCVYPSYHAYFMEDSRGTNKLILQQEMYYARHKESMYKQARLRGVLIYKEKYPVIVFDVQNLSDEYAFRSLKTEIADSLKYEFDECDGQLIHNKNNKPETYKLNLSG